MSTSNPPQTPQPSARTQGAWSETLPDALALARRLAQRREHVELQGTVIHRGRDLTLAATAAAAAVAALLGLLSPALGLIGVLLVLLSGYRDLEGGEGWVRRLVLKNIGHNVILWRSLRTLPTPDPAIYRRRPPRPPLSAIDSGPVLLICAPADGVPDRPDLVRAALKAFGLFGILLAGMGMVWGESLDLWATGLFILIATAAWSAHLIRPPSRSPAASLEHVLDLIDATREHPPQSLALSFAFIEGLSGHADGVEILLRNYAPMLPLNRTRVLFLTPGSGSPAAIAHEGWIHRRRADALLVGAISTQADRIAVTPAARAMRIGYRAATLQGDLSETETLMSILTRLDEHAQEGRW